MPEPQSTTEVKPRKPAPKFQIVINNEERARTLVCRPGKPDPVSKTSAPGPSIQLIPGANIIDARLWDRWKDENKDREVDGENVPGQASLLLKGTIPGTREGVHRKWVSESAGKPYLVEGAQVKSKESPLADLDEVQARQFIDELFDRKMLGKLLAQEKRPAILALIQARIEERDRADAAGTRH